MADLRKIKAGLVKFPIDQFVGDQGNLFFNADTGEIRFSDGTTPGGQPVSVFTFLELRDTPSDYLGKAGHLIKVNSTEDGLEFVAPDAGGTTGGVGLYVKDALDDVSELPQTASPGDSYLVGDEIYIWSSLTQTFVNAGAVTGGGSGGDGVNGSAFVTDIVPQNQTDSVGEKVFSSDGAVLDSCSTTTDLIRVSILALPGNTNYKPVLTVNGVTVTNLTAQNDAPLFRGTVDIDLQGSTTVKIDHEDGASHTVQITVDAPPVVQDALFSGTYPGTQTELKAGDTFSVTINTDIPINKIEVSDYGALTAQTITVTEGTSHSFTATIANRGTTLQSLGMKVRVQKSTGAWSEYFFSETQGTVDALHILKLNNIYPSLSFGVVTYPSAQTAIKGNESATVLNSVSNFDTINYSSPNGELSISNPTTFESTKTVSRVSGTYNVSTNNLQMTAIRNANGSTTTVNTVIKIADTPPTISITISGNPSRLRSGGNDGTSPQNYTINIVSNQQLKQAPTLSAPAGTFQGSAFTGGPTTWSRSLTVTDNDPKGSFNFSSLSAFNLAGVEQTAINSGATYTLGGFVSRQIPLEAFQNQAQMNVAVDSYNKVTLSWSFNAGVTQRAAIDTPAPLFQSWCLLSPIDQKPVIIRILDDSYNASTQQSTITIQETV